MKALRIAALVLAVSIAAAAVWTLSAQAQRKVSSAAEQQRLAGEEIVIVEDVVSARNRYKKNLENLVAFYTITKNTQKLKKANAELAGLAKISKYTYVIVAEMLGPNVRPLKNIPEAEVLYQQARQLDTAPVIANPAESKRRALDAYLTLISRYPESMRVAECAYYIGRIYELTIRDHHRAVVYYEKAFQWDPMTAHPVRIKAARICYCFLNDKPGAKRFYRAAMEKSPNAGFRAEARAMFNLLEAQGY